MKLFLDMDGVFVDFDGEYEKLMGYRLDHMFVDPPGMWDKIRNIPHFFRDLPPMPEWEKLWEFCRPLNPTMLTGLPRPENNLVGVEQDKRDWVAKYLGPDVPVITCPSKDKCLHGQPGDVLVDDWLKYRDNWVDMGGIWITHTSVDNTIEELSKLQWQTTK